MSQKKRGGCLTALLIYILLRNGLGGLYSLLAGSTTLQQFFPLMPSWATPVLSSVLTLAVVVFTVAVWKWKKWGVYGLGASVVVAFFIRLGGGVPLGAALLGLAAFLIFLVLLRPVWRNFE